MRGRLAVAVVEVLQRCGFLFSLMHLAVCTTFTGSSSANIPSSPIVARTCRGRVLFSLRSQATTREDTLARATLTLH